MKHGPTFRQVLLILLCIVLAGGLGYFLLQYRQEERQQAAILREEAKKVQEQERAMATPKPIPTETPEAEEETDDVTVADENENSAAESSDADIKETESDAVSEISVEEEKVAAAEPAAEAEEDQEVTTEAVSEVKEEKEATADSTAAAEEENEEAEAEQVKAEEPITMISCRGDAWQQGEDSDRTLGWPVKLQDVLNEKHIDMTVFDGTWDMSGTLSQMRWAGVPMQIVSGYLNDHYKNGVTEPATETTIRRDLGRKLMERTDYDAIPVIEIGFFGGFGRNLEELVDQQQKILDTYNQQEKFLILGYYPNGWTDKEAYDKIMTDTWGDHYLSLNEITDDHFSETFRIKMAEAIVAKLEELGYIKAGE